MSAQQYTDAYPGCGYVKFVVDQVLYFCHGQGSFFYVYPNSGQQISPRFHNYRIQYKNFDHNPLQNGLMVIMFRREMTSPPYSTPNAMTAKQWPHYKHMFAWFQVFSAEELCVVMCREDDWLMRDVRCEDVLEDPNTVFYVRQEQVCLTGIVCAFFSTKDGQEHSPFL